MTAWQLPRTGRALAAVWTLHGVPGLIDVLRRKVYWRHQYVRFRVDLGGWRIVGSPAAPVEAREGTLAELRRFRESGVGLPRDFYADVIYGARRFYLGLVDGRIGHISWVYGPDERVPQMWLGPGEIMLEGAYTLPEFRGRGLLSAVERAALDDAKHEGHRAAYTHVAVDNRASLRGVWKTGFRPVGVLTRRSVLGIATTRYVDSEDVARTAALEDVSAAPAQA